MLRSLFSSLHSLFRCLKVNEVVFEKNKTMWQFVSREETKETTMNNEIQINQERRQKVDGTNCCRQRITISQSALTKGAGSHTHTRRCGRPVDSPELPHTCISSGTASGQDLLNNKTVNKVFKRINLWTNYLQVLAQQVRVYLHYSVTGEVGKV